MKKILALILTVLMLANICMFAYAHDSVIDDGCEDYSVSPTALTNCPRDPNHAGVVYSSNGINGHAIKCAICGAGIQVAVPHVWDIAQSTCTRAQKCTLCNYVAPKADHNWGSFLMYDHQRHSQSCTNSGCSATELGAHSYGPAYYLTYRNLSENNEIYHDIWMDCLDCGYEKEIDNYRCLEQSMACDGHCNN